MIDTHTGDRRRRNQIDAMVGAAREDKMGTYAEGLMDRVLATSKDAIAKVKDAAAK